MSTTSSSSWSTSAATACTKADGSGFSAINGIDASFEQGPLSGAEEEAVMNFMTETTQSWFTALKFLSAEDFSVPSAIARWKRCMAYLKTNGVGYEPESTASLTHYLHFPIFYLPPNSHDDLGATIMVFNARFWVPDAAGKRRMLKLLVHMCHKAVTMDRVRRHGITLISNLDGLDRRNQAVELHRWLMELLEFVLPVHLQRVLICNAPWWAQVFPYAWRPGACPSGQLKADIQICKNLTDFMDISQIPRDLGGELVYKHKEWIADQVRIEHAAEESIMVDVDLDTNDSPTSACAAPTPVLSRSSSTTYIFNPGMLLGSPHSTSGKSYFSDKQERDPLPRQHIDEEVAMLDMSEAFGSLPSDIDLPGDTDTQDALVSVNSEVHLTKVH